MLYALLPHLGPMGAENVIAPARELIIPRCGRRLTLQDEPLGDGFRKAIF